jgi:hypothetical protein
MLLCLLMLLLLGLLRWRLPWPLRRRVAAAAAINSSSSWRQPGVHCCSSLARSVLPCRSSCRRQPLLALPLLRHGAEQRRGKGERKLQLLQLEPAAKAAVHAEIVLQRALSVCREGARQGRHVGSTHACQEAASAAAARVTLLLLLVLPPCALLLLLLLQQRCCVVARRCWLQQLQDAAERVVQPLLLPAALGLSTWG